jgi:putative phosphoesterase
LPKVKKILLLSDTHGCAEPDILKHAPAADEIWHAGDWGGKGLVDLFEKTGKPLRSVWGNIDGQELRVLFPLNNIFMCEGLKVRITHIGGYPGKYSPGIARELREDTPGLFISGHSHILRVMRDKTLNGMLFMNPGAAGRHGFHIMRTMLSFEVNNAAVGNVAVIELGKRTAGILPDLQ